MLLDAGANVNALHKEMAALHRATISGHDNVVTMLLDAKAKVDITTVGEITPLHLATYKDHRDAVKQLIKAGANVDAVNMDGFTAIDIAKKIKITRSYNC